MEPASTAAVIAASSSTGGVFGAAIVAFLILIPIVVKILSWSKETAAHGELYKQLSEQVDKQRKDFETIYKERNLLQEEVFKLKSRVEYLESCESTIDMLKARLDKKDAIIAERDARINKLLNEVMKLKDRIHHLELRLTTDENQWCNTCKYKEEVKDVEIAVEMHQQGRLEVYNHE